jgi:nicotinamide-nucleotide amidase
MGHDVEWNELVGDRVVTTAESCTGGLVAIALASASGSSDWFRGGLVAYQSETKFRLLGVSPGPVVSERAAAEMAVGAAKLLEADVTVAVTGAAGPEPLDGAPPGTIVIATHLRGGATSVNTYCFEGSPEQVCMQGRDRALHDLRDALSTPSERSAAS